VTRRSNKWTLCLSLFYILNTGLQLSDHLLLLLKDRLLLLINLVLTLQRSHVQEVIRQTPVVKVVAK
jgi:hypothetical protein